MKSPYVTCCFAKEVARRHASAAVYRWAELSVDAPQTRHGRLLRMQQGLIGAVLSLVTAAPDQAIAALFLATVEALIGAAV